MPVKAKSPRVHVGERGGRYTVAKNGERRYVKRNQKGGGGGEPPPPRGGPASYTTSLQEVSPSISLPDSWATTGTDEGGAQNDRYVTPIQIPESPGSPGLASATRRREGVGSNSPGGQNYGPTAAPFGMSSSSLQASSPGNMIFGGKVRRKPDTVHRGGSSKAKPRRTKPPAKKTRRAKCK